MTRSFLVSLHVEDGSVPAAVTGRSQISVFGEMLPPEGPWKRAALSGKMPPETRRGRVWQSPVDATHQASFKLSSGDSGQGRSLWKF